MNVTINTPSVFQNVEIVALKTGRVRVTIWNAFGGWDREMMPHQVRSYIKAEIHDRDLREGGSLHDLIVSRLPPCYGSGW